MTKKHTIENRYKIEDLHVIDTENGNSIYIREILDAWSNEFTSSNISAEQRLDIIANLGLNSLTDILEECYKTKEGSYNAAHDAISAFSILLEKIYPNFSFQPVLPRKEKSEPYFALRVIALK